MFDIGFWELVTLFVVALLILGPEKLPRVANTLGRWVGQGRTVIRNLRRQMNVELALKEEEERNKDTRASTAGKTDTDTDTAAPTGPDEP